MIARLATTGAEQMYKLLIGTIIYYETSAPEPARKRWCTKLNKDMDVVAHVKAINMLHYTKVNYIVRVYAKD